jgi:hypothetical protein
MIGPHSAEAGPPPDDPYEKKNYRPGVGYVARSGARRGLQARSWSEAATSLLILMVGLAQRGIGLALYTFGAKRIQPVDTSLPTLTRSAANVALGVDFHERGAVSGNTDRRCGSASGIVRAYDHQSERQSRKHFRRGLARAPAAVVMTKSYQLWMRLNLERVNWLLRTDSSGPTVRRERIDIPDLFATRTRRLDRSSGNQAV